MASFAKRTRSKEDDKEGEEKAVFSFSYKITTPLSYLSIFLSCSWGV